MIKENFFVTLFFLFIFFVSPVGVCSSADIVQKEARLSKDVSRLDDGYDLDKIYDQISEVRRDQLNYKIEKDLLKETYSSNIQTINIVVSVILGIFGFLGFFGLKDLNSLKGSYEKELVELGKIKSEYEMNAARLKEEHESVKSHYEFLAKTNEEQNNKIKILELRDRIADLCANKRYNNALEYCAVALELDKENVIIKNLKALSLFKLDRYDGAIEVYRDILEADKENYPAMSNLCELFLFTGNVIEFDEMYKKVYKQIEENHGDVIGMYFNVVKSYVSKNYDDMIRIVSEILDKYNDDDKVSSKWQFNDFFRYLKSQPESKEKNSLLALTSFLMGQKAKSEIIKSIVWR